MVAVTTAKPRPRLLAQVLRPPADGLIAAHPAEDGARGDGQHRGQRMAPALAAAGVGDVGETSEERKHLVGAQHDLGGSVTILRVENRTRQPGLGVAVQRADKDPLRRRGRAAVAGPGAAKATRVTHLTPVGGVVEGAVEMARIDEGFQ